MADAMGIPQYRTVPKPLVSMSYDIPGFDRYEAGMLINFLRRTDAGALDSFSSGYHACQANGLIDSCGFIDDAGMPQSWYDVIGRQQARIIQLFKNWSGGKFMQGDIDLVNRHFSELMAHATDDEKWTRFNLAKNLTFKLLDGINAPIISGGATPEQAVATMMRVFGRTYHTHQTGRSC
jgi:hypothetical protein